MRRLAVVLGFSLVAVACGGQSTSDEQPGSPSSPTSAPVATTAAPSTTTSSPATTPPTVDTAVARFISAYGEVGDCVDVEYNSAGDEFDYGAGATVASCDGPHDHEVFFVGELAGGPDAPWPGTDALIDLVFRDLCEGPFQDRYGVPSDFAATLAFWATWPLEEEWDAGLRTVKCSATGVFNAIDGEPLVGDGASAGLSLPGHLLATVASFDDGHDIYLYSFGDGGEILDVVNVTSDDLELTEELSPPSWSPDLNSLVYSANAENEETDIYVIDVATGVRSNITNHPANDSGAVLSPDGTRVAFTSNRNSDDLDIFVMNTDGSDVTQLTFDGDRESSPDWSPDGSRIVYRKRTGGNSDIWTMNADGTNQAFLVGGPAGEYDPDWSPDGSTIVFISDEGGDFDLWTFPAEGFVTIGAPPSLEAALATRVTDHPGNEEYPDWTPDGEAILFNSDRHGTASVWMVRADGSDATNLLFTYPVGYPQVARP